MMFVIQYNNDGFPSEAALQYVPVRSKATLVCWKCLATMIHCRAQLSIFPLCRCLVKYTALVFAHTLPFFRHIYFTMEHLSSKHADNYNIGAIQVPGQGKV